MSPQKRAPARREAYDLPPDIFWITPDGHVMDVIGHLTEMQSNPEAFGLPASPRENGEAKEAFDHVFSDGWVRGRTSAGTISFQMDRPRGLPMGNAYDMALRHRAALDTVEIDFYDPAKWKLAKTMSIDDFLAQKFPQSWGLGSRKGRR